MSHRTLFSSIGRPRMTLRKILASMLGENKAAADAVPVRNERHTYIKGIRHNFDLRPRDRVHDVRDTSFKGTIFRIRNGVASVRWDKPERRSEGCMVLVSDIAKI